MAEKGSSDVDEDSSNSNEDTRMLCKYGAKCYQKNPAHHKKYKHPKAKRPSDEINIESPKKTKHESSGSGDQSFTSLPKSPGKDSEHDLSDDISNEQAVITLPSDSKKAIKQIFLVDMPEDFYNFWEFCKSLQTQHPENALKDIGLLLVGPFDVLSGAFSKVKNCGKNDYLRHWRYYYDPPEFQTVFKGNDKELFHIGYYRDDPKELPVSVASNCAAVNGILTHMADNLFAAVNSYLDTLKGKCDPFRKMKITSFQKKLQTWANEKSFTLETKTSAMKTRDRKVVAKTFHKAGIVVPVDKKTDVGYRPLIETEAHLKTILTNYAKSDSEEQRTALMGKLQPIITAANIANDECDFGASLELGLDLFTFGGDMFHKMVVHLLCTAYSLLQRDEFAEIIKAHLENRKKGSKLSILHN